MLNGYMTLEEFNELAIFISNNHGIYSHKSGGKFIKYIRPSFDTRVHRIFSITLDDTVFSITNENRKRNLKKWIYAWLNNEDDGFDYTRDDPEIDWKNLLKNMSSNVIILREQQ